MTVVLDPPQPGCFSSYVWVVGRKYFTLAIQVPVPAQQVSHSLKYLATVSGVQRGVETTKEEPSMDIGPSFHKGYWSTTSFFFRVGPRVHSVKSHVNTLVLPDGDGKVGLDPTGTPITRVTRHKHVDSCYVSLSTCHRSPNRWVHRSNHRPCTSTWYIVLTTVPVRLPGHPAPVETRPGRSRVLVLHPPLLPLFFRS